MSEKLSSGVILPFVTAIQEIEAEDVLEVLRTLSQRVTSPVVRECLFEACAEIAYLTSSEGTFEEYLARETEAVHADHLSKWYGQVIGLNDISVSVPPGITGLLGPNGAGKSTFMKLMTGQLRPSQGSITVLGQPIWRNPGLYFRIGFCPEQDAFYDRMTGLADAAE